MNSPVFALTALIAVTLQLPGAEPALKLTSVADATLSSNGGGPGGTHPSFRLMGDAEKHRGVLLFEFKDNATRPCTAAVLRLTTDKCWPNTKLQHIRVHRLLRPFDEKTASWINCVHQDQWINPGGDFDPMPVCARRLTKDDNGGGKAIDIDVTPLVIGWQNKALPNYGLLVTLEDGSDTNVHFHSREAQDESARPQLHLYYGAAPAKNPDMMAASTLKPMGTMPQLKMDMMSSGDSRGTVGGKFSAKYMGRGGIAPYGFKATGLPDGLTLADTGELTGSPTKAGVYNVTITITGSDKKSITKKVSIDIQEKAADAKPAEVDLGGKGDKPEKKPPAPAKPVEE